VEGGAGWGAAGHPALAYGRGRSYGDSCLNADGLLLETGRLDRFVAFDPVTGLLEAQAGVTLAGVLAHVCRPAADGSAWFPAVLPGTRWVTLGGALANDVHGKNHHREGSFGCHVPGFTLLRGDGRVLACSALDNPELYRATIGGLGLTGLVLDLKLRLRRVPGLMLAVEEIRTGSLDEFYAISAESEAGWEYAVAWVDCRARGREVGRGIFSRANHAPGPIGPVAPPEPRLRVPLTPPFPPLNRLTLGLLNTLYRRRLGWRRRTLRLSPYAPVLFPLDAVAGWNRLYGRRGFVQWQCVVPDDAADVLRVVLERLHRAGSASFLTVLKRFGPGNPGPLSFPQAGWTLALDLPAATGGLAGTLDRLDRLVADSGGRIYLAKDVRLAPELVAAMYPRLDEWRAVRHRLDPAAALQSDLGRRLGLVGVS
jgi:FAD/FMN-containing dehydrogenase